MPLLNITQNNGIQNSIAHQVRSTMTKFAELKVMLLKQYTHSLLREMKESQRPRPTQCTAYTRIKLA